MVNVPVLTFLQVFVWTYAFISLGQIPRSTVVESYDSCMFTFFRNYQTAFQSCTILRPHQHCM